MVDSKHQWKAWVYLFPAIILLIIFTVWPIFNTVVTAFIYNVEYKPASIQVESVENAEGEYYFYFADEETNQKRYLSAVSSDDGSIHLGHVSTPDAVRSSFKYDASLLVWTLTVDEKQYFVAATDESDADLIEANEENVGMLGSSIYPANLILNGKIVTNPVISAPSAPEAEVESQSGSEAVTESESETTSETEIGNGAVAGTTGNSSSGDKNIAYQFGVFKGMPEALRYILATGENGYLDTTDDLDNAAEIAGQSFKVGEKRGYKLYVPDAKLNPTVYMNVVIEDDGSALLEYAEATDVLFSYNATHTAWTCTVNETEYYLGLDGINRIGVYPVSEIAAENAPAPVEMYLHRSAVAGAKPAESLLPRYAYRIGVNRVADGEQYFATTGVSENGGLMLTQDVINGESFQHVGINNFVKVLTSRGSDFMTCLLNTFILTVTTVPLSTVLALLIAVALNSIKPFQKMLQTIFFLPYVTNSIAIGMVFAAMFNIVGVGTAQESVGIVNNVLGVFGIERINWINQGAPAWASFTALIVYIVWNALPFKILILLGGLQSINKQYYDAAKIDSTPKWRVLTRITVPLLSPMLTYTIITSFIGGFKEYSSVVGIFGDSRRVPGGANMNTIVGHIQDHLEITQDYGLAGAAALMLFVIIFIVTMINLRISKKSTHY